MEHTINIDIPRTLKFNFAAFAFLQDVEPAVFTKIGRGNLNVIRLLTLAGLRHEKKYLPSEVDAMFDTFMENGGKIAALEAAIIVALNESTFVKSMTPDPEPKVEAEEPKN